MANLINDGKRGGKEMSQESAKTDGMCKGGETGIGSAPDLFAQAKRGGSEYKQVSAKTDGMCKS
jgi:hypothetical protein